MNSCFRSSETGEMTGGDVNALLAMYPRYGEDLRWSSNGLLAGKPYCTRISEPSDPYTGTTTTCARMSIMGSCGATRGLLTECVARASRSPRTHTPGKTTTCACPSPAP
ncbi:hypothetical protein ACN28S_32210 [Cystobacter fuscus]